MELCMKTRQHHNEINIMVTMSQPCTRGASGHVKCDHLADIENNLQNFNLLFFYLKLLDYWMNSYGEADLHHRHLPIATYRPLLVIKGAHSTEYHSSGLWHTNCLALTPH